MRKSILLTLLLTMVCGITQAQGLKDAYKNYFKIGVAVNVRNVTIPEQMDLVKKEFNSVTAENDMKPEPTEPKEGEFNWENADKIANFCRANGIKMRGHCLMWHSQIGKWMTDSPTKEVFYQRMKNHINAVVSRYKDVVYCWDVVNEAMTDDKNAIDPYRQSPMYKLCGDEFIAKAFQFAHEADPKALLFYNDYNECDPVKSQRIFNMVKAMKQAGVPIDGIGMQGHYNIYGPTEKEVDDALNLYKKIVKHIHVTELDIRVNTEMGGQLRFSQGDFMQIIVPGLFHRCVHFLERSETERSRRDLSGQDQHGDGVGVCRAHSGDDVGGTGSAGHQADPGLAARPGESVGHVAGALLVAYENVVYGRVQDFVIDRDDGSSGVAEDVRDIPVLQHFKQRSRAFHLVASGR